MYVQIYVMVRSPTRATGYGFGDGLHRLFIFGTCLHPSDKPEVDSSRSGRKIFQAMELGGVWAGAGFIETYRYMQKYKNKKRTIPASWDATLHEFDSELEKGL